MATFFAQMNPKFPPLNKEHVLVEPFLDAARQLIPFIDMLGSAFNVVSSDIRGNITKLQMVYDTDPVKYSTFHAMLLSDIEMKNTNNSSSATIALLWLRRTLHFLVILLQLIVHDHQTAQYTDNLAPLCKQAYGVSLKKYHGWLTQKVFGVCIKAVPSRKALLTKVAFGRDDLHDEVIRDIYSDTGRIQENIEAIQQLYAQLGVADDDKV